MRILRVVALMGLLGAGAARAEETQTLQVSVTSVSGQSVFLDRGAGVGIEPGIRVRFYPPGDTPVEGVVKVVSTNSARVDLPPGLAVPPVGSKGELDVPVAIAPDRVPVSRDRAVPDHPPWTRETEDRTPDMPLLVPAYTQRPEQRPPQFTGRVYGNVLYSRDTETDRGNKFFTGRTGVWSEATNVFGRGGRVLFAGELDHRTALLANAEDRRDTDLRLDRLSYAIGGEAYAPYRFEGGRFYSIHLPELGLVDGVEGVLQAENGIRAGVGAGTYPLPFNDRQWGDDVGFHMFADYESPTPGELAAILGYQKTWHEGDPDRDQILGRVNAKVSDALWLYSSFRADIYTSHDSIKRRGLEITESWIQARYSPDPDKGTAVSYLHYRWPELQRAEFRDLPQELIRDGRLDRVNLSGWFRPAEALRLSGRLDAWNDQDDNGTGGEIAADWRDTHRALPALHGALFFTEGAFNEGRGLRLEVRQSVRSVSASLGYERFRYDVETTFGGSDSLVRHIIRAQASWGRGNWYYSVSGDFFFGDAERSYTLGVYGVFRF